MLGERVEGAIYEWREQTAAVRVAGEPEERLAAVLAMAEGLREARRRGEEPRAAWADLVRPASGNLTMLPASWERNGGRAGSRSAGSGWR